MVALFNIEILPACWKTCCDGTSSGVPKLPGCPDCRRFGINHVEIQLKPHPGRGIQDSVAHSLGNINAANTASTQLTQRCGCHLTYTPRLDQHYIKHEPNMMTAHQSRLLCVRGAGTRPAESPVTNIHSN